MSDKQSTGSGRNSANQASSINKNHQLLEYNSKEKFLRITLDFMNDVSPIFFDRLIETLPNYRNRVTSITIRVIFKPKDKDDLNHTMTRHGILEDVVDKLNNFQRLARVRFVLNLDYLSLSQIESASAIYGLNFRSWTFDILTDDVEHVQHDSAIDILLRAHFGRNALMKELNKIKRMVSRSLAAGDF
ncbi:59bdf517-55f5-45be-9176-60de109e2c04 [Sclerotinia trifoliorum]|uniref:59bdf517-55f5-45be-9176-60de109e2c04 n=1 Tax=Sclerotinia trifoliorum TaxID=28548 RepID=A0A8H2VM03_9HELO|nr:59bdf517-55f5-45be-9176-60de109e2c04 [Sclerotinia trifoliorum]